MAEIVETKQLAVQFSEDEMEKFDLSVGDRFEMTVDDDGNIHLKKFAEIDLEISEFSREMLEYLVGESCLRNISVGDLIAEIASEVWGTEYRSYPVDTYV